MTNILDTVEPDWYGNANSLYSRETVDRLLAEHRKQVLLEAAEVSMDAMHTTTRDGYNLACSDIRDELRRMAEGEK